MPLHYGGCLLGWRVLQEKPAVHHGVVSIVKDVVGVRCEIVHHTAGLFQNLQEFVKIGRLIEGCEDTSRRIQQMITILGIKLLVF